MRLSSMKLVNIEGGRGYCSWMTRKQAGLSLLMYDFWVKKISSWGVSAGKFSKVFPPRFLPGAPLLAADGFLSWKTPAIGNDFMCEQPGRVAGASGLSGSSEKTVKFLQLCWLKRRCEFYVTRDTRSEKQGRIWTSTLWVATPGKPSE